MLCFEAIVHDISHFIFHYLLLVVRHTIDIFPVMWQIHSLMRVVVSLSLRIFCTIGSFVNSEILLVTIQTFKLLIFLSYPLTPDRTFPTMLNVNAEY